MITGALLAMAALPAVLGHAAIARVAEDWPATASGWAGLFTGTGLMAHIGVPFVALSTAILFMAPGMMVALALGAARSLSTWLLAAVPPALAAAIVAVSLVRVPDASPAGSGVVGWVTMAMIAVATAVAAAVAQRGARPWPLATRQDRITAGAAAAGLLVVAALLAPKLLWESFNGDGAHAFAVSRRLVSEPWPFFPVEAGALAGFPGTTSMLFTWPNAWFLQLLGPVDAAARLPFVLYLPLLALGLQAVAETGGRPLGGRAVATLWLALVPFTLAIAYSATYEPYHADLALPAVQDTLLMVCLLGFVHAMLLRSWGWVLAFGLLMHASLPSGLLLIGCWLVAEAVVIRPVPWPVLARVATVIVTCLLASRLVAWLVVAAGHPAPGVEYGVSGVLDDLMRINLTEWWRVGWVLVGGAMLPPLLLAWWRRQDFSARRITVVALLYFLFFFVQARVSLHHFLPAMLLPLAVALRLRPEEATARSRFLRLWQLAAAVAIVLAAPGSFAIERTTRTVGRTITRDVASLPDSDPRALAATDLLGEIVPPVWDHRVPHRSYGGSPLAWARYARTGATDSATTYVLGAGLPVPDADSVIRHPNGVWLAVRDGDAWQRHLALRPGLDRVAGLFRIAPSTLFGQGGPGTVDLSRLLRGAGGSAGSVQGSDR